MSEHMKRRPYTPDDVIRIYAKNGRNINREKAEMVLVFLRKLAKLTLDQYFRT